MEAFIEWISGAMDGFIASLPDSPFTGLLEFPPGHAIAWVNWLIPVSECLGLLTVFLVVIPSFFAVQWILRFVGAIQ
jgi:hypothetical protein